ncbi:MAG: hypothetical protein ACRDLN_16575 [Solirubrobacteraceae bacterium]
MSKETTAQQPGEPHRPAPADRAEDGTPLAEFPWSDGVVGMGFFPEEVRLPSGWTWSADEIGS